MYSIVLELERISEEEDLKNVHWLSVHSFFEYLFPQVFICVLKPYNKNDAQAKVFFKDKVTIPDGPSSVTIDNHLVIIVDCLEEEDVAAARTRLLRFDRRPEGIDAATEQLGAWLKARVHCVAEPGLGGSSCWAVSVAACHEEVLEQAVELLKMELAGAAAAGQRSQRAGPTQGSTAPAETSPAPTPESAPAPSPQHQQHQQQQQQQQQPRKNRRPLFPAAFAQTTPPTTPQGEEQPPTPAADVGNNKDVTSDHRAGVFRLSPACRLTIRSADLTTVRNFDLVVASTNCGLSTRHGLAGALASRVDGGPRSLEAECQRHLKSLPSGGGLRLGDAFLCQRGSRGSFRQILFVALPNDGRLLDAQLGRGDAARASLRRCLGDFITDRLVREAAAVAAGGGSGGGVRVAMPTLGSTLPVWESPRQWVDALAPALARLEGRAGALAELLVCCVSDEAAAALADAVARQLGQRGAAGAAATAPAASGASTGNGNSEAPTEKSKAPEQAMDIDEAAPTGTAAAAAAAATTGDDDGDTCMLCANSFSPENPPTPFHCNKDGNLLCRRCVSRLTDDSAPSDGKCVVCFERYRPAIGSQPATGGRMSLDREAQPLPGYDDCSTLVVKYDFDAGSHEGAAYKGTSRTAYFPNNRQGKDIVERLQAAFAGRAVFSLGTSATTGKNNAITWGSLHHKTSRTGGPTKHGYPDSGYLKRISDELSALGY